MKRSEGFTRFRLGSRDRGSRACHRLCCLLCLVQNEDAFLTGNELWSLIPPNVIAAGKRTTISFFPYLPFSVLATSMTASRHFGSCSVIGPRLPGAGSPRSACAPLVATAALFAFVHWKPHAGDFTGHDDVGARKTVLEVLISKVSHRVGGRHETGRYRFLDWAPAHGLDGYALSEEPAIHIAHSSLTYFEILPRTELHSNISTNELANSRRRGDDFFNTSDDSSGRRRQGSHCAGPELLDTAFEDELRLTCKVVVFGNSWHFII